jgi:hypothetical protein
MAARDILDEEAAKVGWDLDAMLDVICHYVDNQGDNACFADFVACEAADERGDSEEDGDGDGDAA